MEQENAGGEPRITLNQRPPRCRQGAAAKAGAGRGAASRDPAAAWGSGPDRPSSTPRLKTCGTHG